MIIYGKLWQNVDAIAHGQYYYASTFSYMYVHACVVSQIGFWLVNLSRLHFLYHLFLLLQENTQGTTSETCTR